MAGGGFQTLKKDPAVERWALMRENVYQNFKFTRRTTRHVILFGLAVPVGLYFGLVHFNQRYDYKGKLRGESLLRNPPQKEEVEEQ